MRNWNVFVLPGSCCRKSGIAVSAGKLLGFPSPPRNGFRDRVMLAALNRQFLQPLLAWKSDSPHLKHLRFWSGRSTTRWDRSANGNWPPFASWSAMPGKLFRSTRNNGKPPACIRAICDSLEDLRQFPILTKTDIRAHGERLRSDAFRGQS